MAIAHKLLGTAVSLLSLTCAAAYADSTRPIMSPASVVRFNDLNLEQPRDLARLFDRINSAADSACGPRSFGGFYLATADYKACYSDAIARAVASIDKPSVTTYFERRSGAAYMTKR